MKDAAPAASFFVLGLFEPGRTCLASHQISNTRLMMLSSVGEIHNPVRGQGLVGKNYCYQVMSGADVFFDDKFTNEFVGAGALGMCVDECNGDNFHHSDLGFIDGGSIACWTTNARRLKLHSAGPS